MQIVWFKRDLRLEDHEPLTRACLAGPVLPLYIFEPDYWRLPDVSQRHWHFIHDSLKDLSDALDELNVALAFRVGEVVAILEDLRQQYGQFTLWSHEETGNHWTYMRDKAVAVWCRENNISWNEIPSNGVIRRLANRNGWAKQRESRMSAQIYSAPTQLQAANNIKTEEIPAKVDPRCGATFSGFVQSGGFKQAHNVLDSFLRFRSQRYLVTISKPGISARHCSRLSAHIAYGNLSIRQVEQAVLKKIADVQHDPENNDAYLVRNLSGFLSRLIWRCHFVQKLEQQPEMEFRCLHPAFEGMREPHFKPEFFLAWKEARTGYPLIDACMRSLQQNGWITFRMRALLVSFASYHLWLDWRVTAPYLAQLFTDYEPGIHYSQMQMQSGVTGMNAIRMYNPVKQSKDHDPQGKFIRRYLPELKTVPEEFIHEPWLMSTPPVDYPAPIVDHEIVARFAKDEIKKRWQTDGFEATSKSLLGKLGSRRKKASMKKKKAKDQQLGFDI